jgi:DNA-binding beta-propeller fold protein YncE
MKLYRTVVLRALLLFLLMASLTLLSSRTQADTGNCGGSTVSLPFTDVMGNPFFCLIAEAYFSGLTAGTSATTYGPTQNVNREQMAAFITRTLDQSLKRGSESVIAEKTWIPQNANSMGLTAVGSSPQLVEFDGTDLWVANANSASVMRIGSSDGRLLDTWSGATSAVSMVNAMGRVFITGATSPGSLYLIDPTQPAGAVTTVTSALGNNPLGVAFDGSRIWTANEGSVSIVSLNPTTITTVSTGFGSLRGILYDGANMWVTDNTAGALLKLNADGSIAQSVSVGSSPRHAVFDGTNIWVPNRSSNSLTVVRAKDAQGSPLASAFVLATLTGNGLNEPLTTAFDGETILVTNINAHTVSLWKAADLTPLGTFSTGANTQPLGACSDGLNFWVTLNATNQLARF